MVDIPAWWLTILTILGVTSAITLVTSAVALPWVLTRLPERWLLDEASASSRHPLVFLARQVLGIMLLVGGVLMLVLPGQGLLTLLAAVIVLDVPGKRRLIARALKVSALQRALTWVRARAGQPPLLLPEDDP